MLLGCPSANVAEFLVKYGAVLGSGNDLNSPLVIHNARKGYSNLTMGSNCHLGKQVFLDLCDAITIEDRVTISMRVLVLTHTDVGASPLRVKNLPPQQAPVLIKGGAYIGAGAIVLQGVTVGECAVVGAGAVVVEDVPSFSVVTGVPARVVRSFKAENELQNRGASG